MTPGRAAIVVSAVAALVAGLAAGDGDKRAPRVVGEGDHERGRAGRRNIVAFLLTR